jgi:GntR family transcriptional repressor for pyruvate dehydrogenase complex
MVAKPVKKTGRKALQAEGGGSGSHNRLYQELARKLFDELAAGKYAVGDRLPTEREFCAEYNVSRPTVREAMIALEVQGLLEVRVGSGAYVLRLPGKDDSPGFNVTAFELTEARLLFEGEAAALAAANITDSELDQLDALVTRIGADNHGAEISEEADREFHLLIAASTGNVAVARSIEELWRMRASSPECVLLHEKARSANVKPVADEHKKIVEALRTRDPGKARTAMRAHLSAVMNYLLFATEQQAMEEIRKSTASTRARYNRIASL